MSPKLNAEIAVIGIDIGKNSFHVVGLDRRGAIVLRQKWSRGQVEARLSNLPPCLIGLEARSAQHPPTRAGLPLSSARPTATKWAAASPDATELTPSPAGGHWRLPGAV
jgi:hypothetical protein